MRILTGDEIWHILASHRMWLAGLQGERANLHQARLTAINLGKADLRGADLSGADLRSACLEGTDFRSANLCGVNLNFTDLRGAKIRGANFSCARLRGANLDDVSLWEADLGETKRDFMTAVLPMYVELPFLRDAVAKGRIEGTSYEGRCACLAGTMAQACRTEFKTFEFSGRMQVDPASPREIWFMSIRAGDTPKTSIISQITLKWIDELLAQRPVTSEEPEHV